MGIMSISLNTLKEAVQIKEQIAVLEARLEKVLGGAAVAASAPAAKGKRGRGKLSAAGRAKIAAAQKLRWAKAKGEAAPAKKARKKRVLSPEGRAKIVAALKKRWANAKK
jgi:hypothetical protein